MITIECRQGTPEWLAARAGVITASEFETAISTLTRKSGDRNVGDPTASADRYCADTAVERIYGTTFGEPPKAWILDRGHELEDEARALYRERTGRMVYSQGVVLTDDRKFGYSTDGEVDDDGLLEVKCPIDTLKIFNFLKTLDASEYIHQIQGGLWLTNRKWCDLVMYAPMLESVGNDLIIKRIWRDDAFIEDMVAKLLDADKRVEAFRLAFSTKAA